MGYYFAKKFYAVLLKLTPEDPSVKQLHYKWHIRTKGIPAGCIERQAKLMTPDKDEVDAVAYFLEDIARNKTVTMDLLLGGTKTRFESNKDFSTSSKRKFTRDVSIKEEMRRYKDVDGKLGEIRLSA